MGAPDKVLGAIRLSSLTDETTSPLRQRERIEWWASGNSARVVEVTEDLGVSGAVAPFDRVGLGPWLTDERAGQWSILVAWKLDRISRSAADTLRLLEWCDKHGKRIVCVDDGIDTATNMGRVWLQLAAIFAQVERTAIAERVLSSRAELRRTGRWAGGAPVYGTMAVPRSDGPGFTVVADPEALPHLRFMVERVMAGDSLNSVAAALNEQGVPTPQDYRRAAAGKPMRGTRWAHSNVRTVLMSRTLLGEMSYEGEPVKGPDGLPVLAGEAVVTLAEWRQVQDRIADRSRERTRTAGASLLLDVGRCARCGLKLHRQRAVKRGVEYRYYRCSGQSGQGAPATCSGGLIVAGVLDEFVAGHLMAEIGHIEVTRRVLVPGDDTATDLAEAVASLEDLAKLAGTARSKAAQNVYAAQMAALDARIARLENAPQRPDEWRDEGTGETYAEAWERGDTAERRRLLLNSGITVTARVRPTEFAVHIPLDVLERAVPGFRAVERV